MRTVLANLEKCSCARGLIKTSIMLRGFFVSQSNLTVLCRKLWCGLVESVRRKEIWTRHVVFSNALLTALIALW